MALQCGIVGLPNVGKSTLFNCLSNAKAQAANFPFCTIEPNVGVITVPDDRLNKLAGLVDPDRIVPTTVEIVDIAGLVKGASKGEGLGNKFLANIRETDAILHVLRCFDDENVTHVDGSVDPVRDKEIIDTELQLKDLETIESRIQKVQKQAQTGGDKVARQTYEVLVRYREALLQGKSARTVQFETKDEQKIAHELFLLTSKPVMYVCNVDEASAVSGNKYVEQVREAVKEEGAEILIVAARTEADIAELETYEDRQMFPAGGGTGRVGREPADTCGLQAAEPGDVLHGRKDGGACLDVPQGMEGSAVCRCHPHGFREGIYPRGGHQVRRLYPLRLGSCRT